MLRPFSAFAALRLRTWNRPEWIHRASFVHNGPLESNQKLRFLFGAETVNWSSLNGVAAHSITAPHPDADFSIARLLWRIPLHFFLFFQFARSRRLIKRMTIDIHFVNACGNLIVVSGQNVRPEKWNAHDSHHLNSFRVRISDNDNDVDGSNGSHRRSTTLCVSHGRMRAAWNQFVSRQSGTVCSIRFQIKRRKNPKKK